MHYLRFLETGSGFRIIVAAGRVANSTLAVDEYAFHQLMQLALVDYLHVPDTTPIFVVLVASFCERKQRVFVLLCYLPAESENYHNDEGKTFSLAGYFAPANCARQHDAS